MTIIREVKRCENCHRKFVFNPDVGRGMFCPYCGSIGGTKGNGALGRLFGKKRKEGAEEEQEEEE